MNKNIKLLSINDSQKLSLKEIHKIYYNHINPGLTNSLKIFSFGNDLVLKANKSSIILKNKKKVLDLTGGLGVLNLGHNPKDILKSRIKFQKENRMEVHKNFFSQYSAALSLNLAKILPGNLDYSYFCNSGAEAVDGAIKMAYKYHNGKRPFILHSDIAFHGKLMGSLSVSSYNENTFKFPKIKFGKSFKFNNIKSLENCINKYKSKIFAIILEPFSASTYKENSKEFLFKCRKLCDKYDIKLIFDEIYTGFGKAGDLFYFERYKVIPDILIISKSFGGGKSSISAYVSNKKTLLKSYGNLNDALLHTTTYNGFGEECITAMSSINLLIKKKYYLNGKKIEKIFHNNFKYFPKKFSDKIKEQRGVGSMFGFIFHTKYLPFKKIQKLLPISVLKDKKFLDKLLASAILDELYDKYKILATIKFNKEVILCLVPNLTITDKELYYCIKCLDKLFQKSFNKIIIKFILKSFNRKLI